MLPVRWYRPFADLLFPRVCLLCSVPIVEVEQESLCAKCISEITPMERHCPRCSAPLPATHGLINERPKNCYYCKSRKWSFRRAYCFAVYSGAAAQAARKIKQQSCEPLAVELGRQMGVWLCSHPLFDSGSYDFIIPIPQHWFRRATHRYNQAEVIAENVSKELSIPIRRNWLYRSRWTDKQGTKSIDERRSSLIDSFGCKANRAIRGSKILIVDDIVTSGATAHEAAKALRSQGATRVDIAAFARGVGAFQPKKSREAT